MFIFDARKEMNTNKLMFGKATFADWRGRGHDRNSTVADPLFIAVEQNNFQLQSNSPALKLGFQPIDLSQVGIRRRTGP
jgi:hypothetical protein